MRYEVIFWFNGKNKRVYGKRFVLFEYEFKHFVHTNKNNEAIKLQSTIETIINNYMCKAQ
jgi:hypothetical protein